MVSDIHIFNPCLGRIGPSDSYFSSGLSTPSRMLLFLLSNVASRNRLSFLRTPNASSLRPCGHAARAAAVEVELELAKERKPLRKKKHLFGPFGSEGKGEE